MPDPAIGPQFDSPRLFPLQQERFTADDKFTPPWIFETMGLRFDLDVCAPPGGLHWIPADHYYDQASDGLAEAWHGRVWMNPPFSRPGPWVTRFIEHHHGVCLIQVSKAPYARQLWDTADGIHFAGDMLFSIDVTGRVLPDWIRHGQRSDIFMPVWFAAFGAECVDAIARLGLVRKVG